VIHNPIDAVFAIVGWMVPAVMDPYGRASRSMGVIESIGGRFRRDGKVGSGSRMPHRP
jgi:hypothetical protein